MRGFIIGTAVTAIAFYVLTELLPQAGIDTGVNYDGELFGLVVLAVIFGVVNGLIGPGIRAAAIPISFVTMGLIGFLINAALLLITAWIGDQVGYPLTVGGFPPDLLTADTIVAAIIGSIVLSVVSTIVGLVVPD